MIIVYHLKEGTTQTFKTMEKLLSTYTGLTQKRVEYCIKSGSSWRGMAFDEGAENES